MLNEDGDKHVNRKTSTYSSIYSRKFHQLVHRTLILVSNAIRMCKLEKRVDKKTAFHQGEFLYEKDILV